MVYLFIILYKDKFLMYKYSCIKISSSLLLLTDLKNLYFLMMCFGISCTFIPIESSRCIYSSFACSSCKSVWTQNKHGWFGSTKIRATVSSIICLCTTLETSNILVPGFWKFTWKFFKKQCHRKKIISSNPDQIIDYYWNR